MHMYNIYVIYNIMDIKGNERQFFHYWKGELQIQKGGDWNIPCDTVLELAWTHITTTIYYKIGKSRNT